MSLLFWEGSFHSSSFFGEGMRLATPYPSSLAGCPLMSCHTAMLTFQNLQAVQQRKKYATHLRRWTFPNCDPTRQSHDDIYITNMTSLHFGRFLCTKAILWYIFGHIWTLDTSELITYCPHSKSYEFSYHPMTLQLKDPSSASSLDSSFLPSSLKIHSPRNYSMSKFSCQKNVGVEFRLHSWTTKPFHKVVFLTSIVTSLGQYFTILSEVAKYQLFLVDPRNSLHPGLTGFPKPLGPTMAIRLDAVTWIEMWKSWKSKHEQGCWIVLIKFYVSEKEACSAYMWILWSTVHWTQAIE